MEWRHAALAIALLMAGAPSVATAHGGGGGGYVYIPIYGGSGPALVPPAKTGDYSKIKTVAVISAIAQKLTLGSPALLEKKHKEIDVSDWALDRVAEKTVAQYLASRFTVKDVPHDPAPLAAIPNDHFDTGSEKPVRAYLAALPAESVDAFIVLRPDSEAPGPGIAGLSVDSTNNYFLHPAEIASYEIDVVDAKSGATLAHALSRIALRKDTAPSFAAINAPPDLRLSYLDTPSDRQRAELKNDFARLIARSLRETLRSLDLGIALPEVGARDPVPIPLEKNPLKKIHAVAVISAVGDRLELNHRGAFFRHSDTTTPIEDWNLDGEIEAKLAASLDKRLTVKSVTADRTKLAKLTITFDDKTLATPLDGLTQTSDVDAYIVVLKNSGPVGGMSDTVSGLGLWNMNGAGGESSGAFARYALAIVDPHTLKPVWLQRGIASPAFSSEIPLQFASNADWPKDGGAPTPEQAKRLRQTFAKMMDDSVPETMLRMTLTGMMVAPAPGVTDLSPRPGAAPAEADAAEPSPTAGSPSPAAQPAAKDK